MYVAIKYSKLKLNCVGIFEDSSKDFRTNFVYRCLCQKKTPTDCGIFTLIVWLTISVDPSLICRKMVQVSELSSTIQE